MKIDLQDPYAGIVCCEAHTMGMSEDCDYCMAEFQAKSKVVEALGADIQTDITSLATRGINFPAAIFAQIRLELLVETFLTDRNRIHYETEVARRVTLELIDAKKDATRSKLLAPNGAAMAPSALNLKR